MAFEKHIQNRRTGHANNYWRVTGVVIDAPALRAVITLSGYASASARNEGKQPDDSRTFELLPQQFAALASAQVQSGTLFGAVATACYTYIKAIEDGEFADAVDVL